ncbi:hypothetical protein PXK30_00145 [Phaeobacter gallaeciensis]|nr:hypothetical protein [Phaeobacter gallaeciensis]MDE4096763.1 hypothetical protein [Phaeobacter gallaeciensis]MDE4110030.1 hypothetical protein [Phaeobacter gallaeciensis]MDE4169318.1 hypothetical protein [Phaeobacter gallaeciensis]MDE4202296.1 hypothetical protein [Phaeobacter gallaeciensis]MDE4302103.1 hypothetical protein [Phaeobacter gallaeciensis]
MRGLLGINAERRKTILDGFFTLSYTRFMADKKSPKTSAQSTTREDRLKAALKANMARRKAQAKARAGKQDEQTGGSER